MTNCNPTLDKIPERAHIRLELIKEAKDPLQQSREVENLLEVLRTEPSTKQILDELKTSSTKKEQLLCSIKQLVFSWFKTEFEYFRSIANQTQHCCDNLIDKAEACLSGKIGGFNSGTPSLWEQLWEVYKEICKSLVESGYSHLIGDRVTTYKSEEISWTFNNESSWWKCSSAIHIPPYDKHCASKIYLEKVTIPAAIQSLFQHKKDQENGLHANDLVNLWSTLSSISLLHSYKPNLTDTSKITWAEVIGLGPSPNPLELDAAMTQFNNDFFLARGLPYSHSFLEIVSRKIERFLQLLQDKILHVNSLKGPQLKSYHSGLAHDWYFVHMHQFLIVALEKGFQPTQKEIIGLTRNLKSFPEYLKVRDTPNLREEACKELAKITGWSCPGGRPKKTSPTKP